MQTVSDVACLWSFKRLPVLASDLTGVFSKSALLTCSKQACEPHAGFVVHWLLLHQPFVSIDALHICYSVYLAISAVPFGSTLYLAIQAKSVANCTTCCCTPVPALNLSPQQQLRLCRQCLVASVALAGFALDRISIKEGAKPSIESKTQSLIVEELEYMMSSSTCYQFAVQLHLPLMKLMSIQCLASPTSES